jgi:hypothetical protein
MFTKQYGFRSMERNISISNILIILWQIKISVGKNRVLIFKDTENYEFQYMCACVLT